MLKKLITVNGKLNSILYLFIENEACKIKILNNMYPTKINKNNDKRLKAKKTGSLYFIKHRPNKGINKKAISLQNRLRVKNTNDKT